MGNNVVWTILGILAILALLLWIFNVLDEETAEGVVRSALAR